MEPVIRNRLIAGAVLLVASGVGTMLGRGTTVEAQARAASVRAQEKTALQAQAEALDRDFNYKSESSVFAVDVENDLRDFGLRPMTVDDLAQPNTFAHPIESPRVLKNGKSLSTDHLSIAIKTAKLMVKKQGISVNRPHTIAVLKNIAEVPIAYRVSLHGQGECEGRGGHRHNAIALLPGESAQLSVCAGNVAVVVEDVRIVEVSPLGFMYLSKLPPQALAMDAASARSHEAPRKAKPCSSVPASRLGQAIERGDAAWEDIIDFYSRHNCERWQYVPGYARAAEPLASLPFTAG